MSFTIKQWDAIVAFREGNPEGLIVDVSQAQGLDYLKLFRAIESKDTPQGVDTSSFTEWVRNERLARKQIASYLHIEQGLPGQTIAEFFGVTRQSVSQWLQAVSPEEMRTRQQERKDRRQANRQRACELLQEGYSQSEIARELDVKDSTVSRWFKGG